MRYYQSTDKGGVRMSIDELGSFHEIAPALDLRQSIAWRLKFLLNGGVHDSVSIKMSPKATDRFRHKLIDLRDRAEGAREYHEAQFYQSEFGYLSAKLGESCIIR
jgi:hypothetical protein